MNEEYYRGRYDQLSDERSKLIEELHKWKIAFGWSLAGILITLFILASRY